MHLEKTREVLRLFERMAAEQLAWLMRVHSALMFPDRPPPPPSAAADAPQQSLCQAACARAEDFSHLLALRADMHAQAEALVSSVRAEGKIDPEAYGRFMASVDAYSREARRVENHFRRLLVETDPLTGVYNRQGMMRDLRREWTRALRTGQPLCLALADLDHFKQVNDTHGHAAGDKVLCAAARFFQRRLRPYDIVYRYGGEEFLFCLPNTDGAQAVKVLERLRKTLARVPVALDDGARVAVTCSIGIAQMVPGRSVHEALLAADQALYAAKESGRNRVILTPAGLQAAGPEAITHRLQAQRGAARH